MWLKHFFGAAILFVVCVVFPSRCRLTGRLYSAAGPAVAADLYNNQCKAFTNFSINVFQEVLSPSQRALVVERSLNFHKRPPSSSGRNNHRKKSRKVGQLLCVISCRLSSELNILSLSLAVARLHLVALEPADPYQNASLRRCIRSMAPSLSVNPDQSPDTDICSLSVTPL